MSEKSISEMTTRELRTFIRETTAEVNERLLQYYTLSENPNPVVMQAEKRLQSIAGTQARYGSVGLGLTGKVKSELVYQARALQEFIQMDIYSPQGIQRYTEKEQRAYKSFSENYGYLNLSIDEYHDIVEIFGAIGPKMLEEFDYKVLLQIYSELKQDDESGNMPEMGYDFVSILVDVKREMDGRTDEQGNSIAYTQEELIDRLRDKLDKMKDND